jgi:oxygen-independent coproporphyrinogen-3 oxidase
MPGFNMYNFADRHKYMDEVLKNKVLPHLSFGPTAAPERGIVSFPYRGGLQKSRVPWDRVPDETLIALQKALEGGLIVDQGERYALTKVGWLFYVNLMYYFMPSSGKQCLSARIERQEREGRSCGNTDLTDFPLSSLYNLRSKDCTA